MFAHEHRALDQFARDFKGMFAHLWHAEAVGQGRFHIEMDRMSGGQCRGKAGGVFGFDTDDSCSGPEGFEGQRHAGD